LEDAILGFQTAEDAIRFAQLKNCFDHRGHVTMADVPQMTVAQHLLRYEYPRFRDEILLLSETPAATRGAAIEFQTVYGGKVFASNILYFHAFHVLSILRYKNDVSSICEIGGGYGNPALIWLTNPVRRVSQYVILDMPESLFFAEVFLRTAAPDVEIHYATEESPASAIDLRPSPQRVTLVPIQLARQTDHIPFDIVVNTGSMAEMSDDWVRYWGDWLDRQNTGLFYSHNLFGNPIDNLYEGRSTLAPVVPRNWRPVDVRSTPPMMMLQSDERLTAEIIFERAPSTTKVRIESALDFFDGLRLSLANYVHLLYAMLHLNDDDNRHLKRFVNKVMADFQYPPVELLYLLQKVQTDDDELLVLRADLQRRFEGNFPQGPHAPKAIDPYLINFVGGFTAERDPKKSRWAKLLDRVANKRLAELLCSLARAMAPLAKALPPISNLVDAIDRAGSNMWNQVNRR
jgi:putative sugar O-methyltransferase